MILLIIIFNILYIIYEKVLCKFLRKIFIKFKNYLYIILLYCIGFFFLKDFLKKILI